MLIYYCNKYNIVVALKNILFNSETDIIPTILPHYLRNLLHTPKYLNSWIAQQIDITYVNCIHAKINYKVK